MLYDDDTVLLSCAQFLFLLMKDIISEIHRYYNDRLYIWPTELDNSSSYGDVRVYQSLQRPLSP